MSPGDRLVYSTRSADQPVRTSGKPAESARRRADSATPRLAPNTVYVERSRKGRAGKTVTLVQNAPGDAESLRTLLKALKAACGAGGTLKDGVIEIQGDQRDRVVAHLERMGCQVKLRGG